MRPRRRFGTIAVKGLTPLLDCLFLLLISLLALSEAKSSQRAELVHVDLPAVEPGAGAPAETPRRIVLQVDGDSRLQLVGPEGGPAAPIGSRGELDQALGGVLADAVPEEIVVEIRADRDARHGVAVELLQYLRLRGFVQIQLLATGTRSGADEFGWSAGEGPR